MSEDEEIERAAKELTDGEIAHRGEGDAAFPSKADIALWRRAFREKWPLSDGDRNQIVRDVMDYFILAKSGRDKLNAAKVLMLADALNVKRASMIGAAVKSQPSPQVQVNVGLGVQLYLPDNGRGGTDQHSLPDGCSK